MNFFYVKTIQTLNLLHERNDLIGLPIYFANHYITLQDYRPVSKDYSKHIAENIAKGSKMCPFGSMFIKEEKKLPDDFDINGYDPNAPDSDDEPLSDIDL